MVDKLDFSPKKIIDLYRVLPEKIVIKEDPYFNPLNVAGCDVGYRDIALVSCVIWNIKEEKITEEITRKKEISAEYIPTRFTLRELPLIAGILSEISKEVDCLIIDGHGIAHPDRAGLASFAGVIFNLPTVGCAKNILVGEYKVPIPQKGEYSNIIYKGEKVGEALCTKDNTTPVFVSPGHLMGFESSRRLILKLAINSKYPEPLRLADINTKII